MKSPKRAKSRIVKRSVRIDGRLSSVSLENQFWDALKEIAKERGATLQDLVATIKAEQRKGNLSSAIRVFVDRVLRSTLAEVKMISSSSHHHSCNRGNTDRSWQIGQRRF